MSQNEGGGSLAWPDHDTGPTPPPEYTSRERDEDRPTRKPMSLWDRIKILVFLLGAWGILLWNTLVSFEGVMPFGDGLRRAVETEGWLLVLAGLELVRQIHYFISERSAGYHRFWSVKVFGGTNRRLERMNDWTRYRMGRALKLIAFLVIVDLVLARVLDLHPATALFQLPSVLLAGAPLILQLAFSFFFIIFQFVGLFWFLSRGGVDTYMPDDIKTRFTDVWGQDRVLDLVKENMIFLEDPESIETKGGYVPGGILLWGPPGTGKTLMAEAVAGETGRPFVFVDPGAFINMFIGVGILKVKGLFRKLRKLSVRYGGVIVFFDEADALGNRGAISQPGGGFAGMNVGELAQELASCNGAAYQSERSLSLLLEPHLHSSAEHPPRKRDGIIMGGGMGGGGMGTLQALLTELSGLKKPRGFLNRIVRRILGMRPKPPPKYRILVMMATNMPQALDEALLRPGRIDRIYKVGYPSKSGRIKTYEGYLAKVAHELTPEEIEKLATMTPYATGATIKDLVNEALINAIREGSGTIRWRNVLRAKQLKDLGPPEDLEYIERERHTVAIHEACHAVVAYRMRHHLTIDIATIEGRGTFLGLVSSIKPEDQFTTWRSEHEADIMVSLAALAGERIFFEGDSSSGVSGDLRSATGLAIAMEGYWGMGKTISSHAVTRQLGVGGGIPRPGEDKEKDILEGSLGERIEDRLRELMSKTEELIRENRHEVLAVAHALETHKTMTGDDVRAIVEGEEGPLVDGRPYAQEESAEMLEEYHSLALAAHQGHASLGRPLPQLAPTGGPSVAASEERDEAPES